MQKKTDISWYRLSACIYEELNIDNLIRLMQEMEYGGPEHFDMEDYASGDWKTLHSLQHGCDTTACIAGYAGTLQGLSRSGVEDMDSNDLALYLDISEDDARTIAGIDYYSPSFWRMKDPCLGVTLDQALDMLSELGRRSCEAQGYEWVDEITSK